MQWVSYQNELLLPHTAGISGRGNLLGCGRVSVCALQAELLDLRTKNFNTHIMIKDHHTVFRRSSKVKVKNMKMPAFRRVSEKMVSSQGHKVKVTKVEVARVKCQRSSHRVKVQVFGGVA